MRVIGSVSVRAFMEQIRTRFYLLTTFFISLIVIGLCYAANEHSLAIVPLSTGERHLPIYVLLAVLFVIIVSAGISAGRVIYRDFKIYKLRVHERFKDLVLVFTGKVIGIGTAGAIQLFIIVILSMALLDYWQLKAVMLSSQTWLDLRHLSPTLFAQMLLFYILGYAQYVGLYVTIGSIQNKSRMLIFILLVTVFLMAAITSCLYMPGVEHDLLLRVGSMFPYSSPFIMIIRLGTEDMTWFQFMMPVFILIGAIWISNWLTIRYYEVVIHKMVRPIPLE